MYFAYVLYSTSIKKYYIGHTKDLVKRLEHHNLGLNYWTKRGIPWMLVYSETTDTRSEAMRKEKYFKSGRGRAYFKEKISQGGSRQDGI